MIFINDVEPMTDRNVRLAAAHAIDKRAIVDRLLRGCDIPIDTLQPPEYAAFDPTITVAHDPEKARTLLAASGYGPENPVRFKIQKTRGFEPKGYEFIQPIAGMWRRVGIEAEIKIYEIAKYFELRARRAGAGSVLQLGQLDRRSVDLDRLIAQEGCVISLLQYVQAIVHSDRIKVTPHVANFLLPQAMQPV